MVAYKTTPFCWLAGKCDQRLNLWEEPAISLDEVSPFCALMRYAGHHITFSFHRHRPYIVPSELVRVILGTLVHAPGVSPGSTATTPRTPGWPVHVNMSCFLSESPHNTAISDSNEIPSDPFNINLPFSVRRGLVVIRTIPALRTRILHAKSEQFEAPHQAVSLGETCTFRSKRRKLRSDFFRLQKLNKEEPAGTQDLMHEEKVCVGSVLVRI